MVHYILILSTGKTVSIIDKVINLTCLNDICCMDLFSSHVNRASVYELSICYLSSILIESIFEQISLCFNFRTCYNANPRPDALMKEQLVEMTSLSPRVIRVWFQNKRCKDKKKTQALKTQMQNERVGKQFLSSLSF